MRLRVRAFFLSSPGWRQGIAAAFEERLKLAHSIVAGAEESTFRGKLASVGGPLRLRVRDAGCFRWLDCCFLFRWIEENGQKNEQIERHPSKLRDTHGIRRPKKLEDVGSKCGDSNRYGRQQKNPPTLFPSLALDRSRKGWRSDFRGRAGSEFPSQSNEPD